MAYGDFYSVFADDVEIQTNLNTSQFIDASITQDVGNALQRLVDQEGFRKVVINLKPVEYLVSEISSGEMRFKN